MILLNIISLGIGQWLHSKHIYWMPECGATILVGFFAGWWVSTHLPPDVRVRAVEACARQCMSSCSGRFTSASHEGAFRAFFRRSVARSLTWHDFCVPI